MHLFLATRGIINSVDALIRDLQAQYYPMSFTDTEGNVKDAAVQMAVRPMQLWELVFPRGSLHQVMRSLDIGGYDHPPTKHMDRYMALMRKLMKAKKLPEIDPVGAKNIIAPRDRPNVHIAPIGYKEDEDITRDGKTFEGL